MPLTWQKSISRTMGFCNMNYVRLANRVFSVAQDCKNVQEMVSNSNRLFSQNEKSAT